MTSKEDFWTLDIKLDTKVQNFPDIGNPLNHK
jgi:hypothetical protein